MNQKNCSTCQSIGTCLTPDACRVGEPGPDLPTPFRLHDLAIVAIFVFVCMFAGTLLLGGPDTSAVVVGVAK